jgi:hypothetical protein
LRRRRRGWRFRLVQFAIYGDETRDSGLRWMKEGGQVTRFEKQWPAGGRTLSLKYTFVYHLNGEAKPTRRC